MSETRKFQHILDGIREDLTYIDSLYWMLDSKLGSPYLTGSLYYKITALEIREWINDVFLDKIYEINSKVLKFLADLSFSESSSKKISTKEMEKNLRDIVQEKKGLGYGNTFLNLRKLKEAIGNYRDSFNTTMDDVRKFLYETNWSNMRKISIEDYQFLTKRRKYVTAREELEWVKQTIKERKYEDVLNHLRTAIDLAIKERFGFKKIFPMKEFLKDAHEYNFLLPSYQTIYDYYDEGSHRLHSGRLNTPYECREALDFVAGFIDELELINISQEEIDNFKKKCRWVE